MKSWTASAAIVCRGNVCWHVNEMRDYPPEAGVVIHKDDWKRRPEAPYEWREHEDHGYWRGCLDHDRAAEMRVGPIQNGDES